MRPSSSSIATGHAAMFFANVMWGIMSPVAKVALPVTGGLAMAFYRATGAALAFWLFSAVMGLHEHVPARDKIRLFLASLCAVTLNQNCFVVGLSYTSPVDATVIATLLPVFTMIFAAIFLREPLSGLKVTGVLCGLSGALLLILSGMDSVSTFAPNRLLGNGLCLIAQCSFVCYLTFFSDLIPRYHPATLLKWMFLFAAFTALPVGGVAALRTDFTAYTPAVVSSILYVVFIGTFLAYLMIPIGQRRLRPTTLSMYNYVQPLTASALAVLWAMEVFTWPKVLAAFLVFLGVWIVSHSRSRSGLG